jgi:bacteriorhodopsin
MLTLTITNASEIFSGAFNLTQAIAFTFFVGSMAMMAATAFFWLEMRNVDAKWRTSMLVSGLITFIAAVHYFYMRDYFVSTGESPTFFRYVDWLLTVPLMCVEFYLITKKVGGKISTMWKLIAASVFMLVTGYIGEAIYGGETQSWIWGAISGLGHFYIIYLVWAGEVAQLAKNAGGAVLKANKALAWFVLAVWAIYPLGYILGTQGCIFGINFGGDEGFMDVIYNIGDAVNKIGFGLVIYALAVSETKELSAAK